MAVETRCRQGNLRSSVYQGTSRAESKKLRKSGEMLHAYFLLRIFKSSSMVAV